MLDVGGGEVAAWISGRGAPVLILHGGPGLSDHTGELAAELGPDRMCIRYQQRGLRPTTLREPYTVETHVDDAVGVLDALGVDRAAVVGHSWGGHLAMHLALAHPGRVAAALVIDPLGALPGGEEEFTERLLSRVPAAVAERAAELDERALAGEGTDADALESLRLLWPAYFAEPDEAPPLPDDLRISVECYASTFASVTEHFARGTLERGLPGCPVPALFLMGRESPLPISEGERSAALMPHARSEVVDGCGHFPWLERPGVVRAALAGLEAG
jgi:proline iminopeptidase